MHYRIKILGYKAIATTAAPYYHYGSQSQNASLSEGKPIVDGMKFEANRAYYTEKWGAGPGQERYVYPFNNPANDPREVKKEWRP